ncbi:MAG: hypothetical protein AAFX87_03880 [Bacteroidota bacterium]
MILLIEIQEIKRYISISASNSTICGLNGQFVLSAMPNTNLKGPAPEM